MAEQQKENSSSDPKEKSSLLGGEYGKEFLTSWKSMSMTDDDAMDFSFGTEPKGKTKAFNFEKLDMDFNLDGDFDKLSSFKVDMSDLDFSCPPKKTGKSKEKPEGELSCGNQGKQDRFSFSFDFNELDSFNLDSGLTKGDKTSSYKLNNKVVSSDGSDCESAKKEKAKATESGCALDDRIPSVNLDSGLKKGDKTSNKSKLIKEGITGYGSDCENTEMPKPTVTESGGALDDSRVNFNLDSGLNKGDKTSNNSKLIKNGITSDGSDCERDKIPKASVAGSVGALDDSMAIIPPASEMVATSKMETLVGSPGNLSSTSEGSVSKLSSSANLVVSHEARTSPEMTKSINVEERHQGQERDLSEKSMPVEPKSQQALEKLPAWSVGQNALYQVAISEQPTEVCTFRNEVITSSGGKQNVVGKMTPDVDTKYENSPLENSHPFFISRSESSNGESVKLASSTAAGATTNDSELAKDYPVMEDNTGGGAFRKTSLDTDDNRGNQKSLAQCPSATTSGPVIDKMMVMQDRDVRSIPPKFFIRPEGTGPLLHQPSSAVTMGTSFGCKRIGDMRLSSTTGIHEGFNANVEQLGSKLVGNSNSAVRESTKSDSVLLGTEKNVRSLCNMREGSNSVDAPIKGKLVGNTQSNGKVTTNKPILLGSEKAINAVSIFSSHANPSSITEKTTQAGSQISVNLQLGAMGEECILNSRINSEEGSKHFPIKADETTADLSIFKTSRMMGAHKVLTTSISQRKSPSLRNSEQTIDIQGSTSSKNDSLIESTEKQKHSTPSLKRKTIEVSDADLLSLKPLKRFSESPSQSRNPTESSENVVEQQVGFCKSQVESKSNSMLYDYPTSVLERPQELNMTEQEIPVLVEDDGNVEKAEAYTKELEDICNMLKKKHGEAKEILVRAIVNNNNLLMLNHPIYEEKVQKFASKLMSKEVQT